MKVSKSPYEIYQSQQLVEPGDNLKFVEIRFLMTPNICGFIIGRNGAFTKKLDAEYSVNLNIKQIPGQDSVAILSGPLQKVQEAIHLMFAKMEECANANSTAMQHIKLLLPPGGLARVMQDQASILKEIAKESQGAKLKLKSDNNDDSIVEIRGEIEQKQSSSCILLARLIDIFQLDMKGTTDALLSTPSFSNSSTNCSKNDARNKAQQGNANWTNTRYRGYAKPNKDSQSLLGCRDNQEIVNHQKNLKLNRNFHSKRELSPVHFHDAREKRAKYRSRSRSIDRYDGHEGDLLASYIDREGNSKISINIVVPNRQVPMIIGKRGDIVKQMMTQSECNISFYREEECTQIFTSSGSAGRFCNLKGSPRACGHAMKLLSEFIIRNESNAK